VETERKKKKWKKKTKMGYTYGKEINRVNSTAHTELDPSLQ
jgi:hypothetical protein